MRPLETTTLALCICFLTFVANGRFTHWLEEYPDDLREHGSPTKQVCHAPKVFNKDCSKCLPPLPTRRLLKASVRPNTRYRRWLGKYKNCLLKEIILPGSHHAGINVKPGRNLGDEWDIPQTMSIADQLKAGIRFVGFRVSSGPVEFVHGIPTLTHNYLYQKLKVAIRDIAEFLKKHKSEVVVIRLELKSSPAVVGLQTVHYTVDWKKVDQVLDEYKNNIYSGNTNPLETKISSLQGKMIICQASLYSKYRRLHCSGSFHITESSMPKDLVPRFRRWLKTLPIFSPSIYYFGEAICTATKKQIERALLFQYCQIENGKPVYVFRSLRDMAEECNDYVWRYLKKVRGLEKRVRAVMTDFVTNRIIAAIVRQNRKC